MNTTLYYRTIATRILRQCASAQLDGRRIDLDTLTTELGVRRADVRQALSALHAQGAIDVTRMRLTLLGFALGRGVATEDVRSTRRAQTAA